MALDFNNLSPEELIAAESAVLTMRALTEAAKSAPHGKGMFCVEQALHDKGFEHLRKILSAAIASHEEGAKKGVCSFPCPCGQKLRFKRCRAKTFLTSFGHISLPMRYFACDTCDVKQTPLQQWAGIDSRHRITSHARRMIVLAGSGCSYDEASRNLKELGHIETSNDVIRRVCDEEGKDVQKWMKQSPEPAKAFAAAKGEIEVSTDGLKINTVDGWREIRQSVISKREPAEPAKPDEWDKRVLEEPTVRIAVCAIAPCGRIGASWERLAKLLGLPPDQDLSFIADGAKWIWDQAAKRFKGQDVQWVVDVYHVMLYLFAVVSGWKKAVAENWVGDKVIELIKMGGPRFIEHLKQAGLPDSASPDNWNKLLHYLGENSDSLWYGRRLEEGLPIGSGLIEGGGKSTLARRLKINSARWRVQRAERMGAIRCLQYSNMWEPYWDAKEAA